MRNRVAGQLAKPVHGAPDVGLQIFLSQLIYRHAWQTMNLRQKTINEGRVFGQVSQQPQFRWRELVSLYRVKLVT